MSADPLLLWSILCGACLMAGIVVAAGGLRARVPRLGDAIAVLEGGRRVEPDEAASLEDRVGAWAERVLRIPVPERVLQRQALRGVSPREFMVEKLIYAALGFITPTVVAGTVTVIAGWSPLVPAGVALVGAVIGFFVPDFRAGRESRAARTDAGEALFTYFDLVTLERLANLSAAQALRSAASLSEVELFVRIRGALDRARMEQRPPYAELTRLAGELGLPELADIADVMRLDETGAALSGALRARVRELRDAHLTRERIAAQAVSERMTVWMTIPSLVFALIFLIPPLLRMLA